MKAISLVHSDDYTYSFNDKDFAALPEVAKLYQACKERDLTIAEREYLKGARDAWQAAKAQAVPEGFVVVPKEPTEKMIDAGVEETSVDWKRLVFGYKAMIDVESCK